MFQYYVDENITEAQFLFFFFKTYLLLQISLYMIGIFRSQDCHSCSVPISYLKDKTGDIVNKAHEKAKMNELVQVSWTWICAAKV